MTIDELTVKITVAADEAEAALERLMEKLQTFQEKTGMALTLDTSKWSGGGAGKNGRKRGGVGGTAAPDG